MRASRNYIEKVMIDVGGSTKRPNNRRVTGAAIVVPSQNSEMSRRTSDHLSIYAVELFAILMA